MPLDALIQGEIAWHKNNYEQAINDDDCHETNTNHGTWQITNEHYDWESFREENITNLHIVFSGYDEFPGNINPIADGILLPSDMRRAQVYVTRACGFPLKADGKVGIKTLNAIHFCQNWKIPIE